MIIVVWGVSGCGKSTIGGQLAKDLGLAFLDADDFHPPANKEKMRRGLPLTDADRWPWLDTVVAELRSVSKTGAVLACSALKQIYRERLAQCPGVSFVQLTGNFDLISQRLAAREHEFMSTSLLQSQFDTLEPINEGLAVSIDQPVSDICAQIASLVYAR